MEINSIIFICFLILTIFNIVILYFIYKSNKDINFKIKSSIEPKFLEIAISPETNKLINLWIDLWRLESRLNEIDNLSEIEKEKLENSINRVKKYTSDYNFEMKGFNWEKYSEEINIYELKATEETSNSELDWIIKNTIEPAVLNDWNIMKQAKVIVYKLKS